MFFRIILLLAVGVAIYWLYRKRTRKTGISDQSEWKNIFKEELPILKKSIPPGYHITLVSMYRSKISKKVCIARLDELLNKMKEEGVDTQPIATLILKIETENNIH